MKAQVIFDGIALAGSGSEVCVGAITSPANNQNKLVGVVVTTNSNVPTAKKLALVVARGTGTLSGTTNNPTKADSQDSTTLQSTGKHTVTGHTEGDNIASRQIDPMQGDGWWYPFDEVKGWGNGEHLLFLMTNPSGEASVNVTVEAHFAE